MSFRLSSNTLGRTRSETKEFSQELQYRKHLLENPENMLTKKNRDFYYSCWASTSRLESFSEFLKRIIVEISFTIRDNYYSEFGTFPSRNF